MLRELRNFCIIPVTSFCVTAIDNKKQITYGEELKARLAQVLLFLLQKQ